MKNLVGRRMTKEVAFLGESVVIQKLSVKEVKAVQELVSDTKKIEKDPLQAVRGVIRIGVLEAADLTDEDFDTFPIDELNALVNEIMAFSGLAEAAAKAAEAGN